MREGAAGWARAVDILLRVSGDVPRRAHEAGLTQDGGRRPARDPGPRSSLAAKTRRLPMSRTGGGAELGVRSEVQRRRVEAEREGGVQRQRAAPPGHPSERVLPALAQPEDDDRPLLGSTRQRWAIPARA